MPEIVNLGPADLLIDPQNPRLVEPNVGQRDALKAIAIDQGSKLLVLAEDIVDHGVCPADLMIVTQAPKDQPGRYYVLEGNRRLSALRALENPETLKDTFDAGSLKKLRDLNKQYQQEPIDSITCIVMDRGEADHWIKLKHTGENRGAGVIKWGSNESERYTTRGGKRQPHFQALDLLEARGILTPQDRRKVPATSYKRLLGTPEVREKIGIDIQDGDLRLLAAERPVLKALAYIAMDLADGKTKVADIYNRSQRVKYANRLPAHVVVAPTREAGAGDSAGGESQQKKKSARAKRRLPRDRLIPRDCGMTITNQRIYEIEDELRRLSLDSYTNAVAVLFRVFLELSIDAYIKSEKLKSPGEALHTKINVVIDHMVASSKLTRDQAKPVRRAAQRDSFLCPSINLMHLYVHNQQMFPAAGDLRHHWDSLQHFFMALWPV